MRTTSLIAGLLLMLWKPAPFSGLRGQEQINFTRDVRPILSNACFQCHGPDEDSREAELRLDQRDGIFSHHDGITIVKPGDHAASEMIRRIMSEDPDEMMPPPEANKPLSEKQKQILIKWIQQGAEWRQHWAFVPPSLPEVPAAANSESRLTEIDHFIQHELRNAQLSPTQIAGPYTLVRRIYLDLIGLQPTPEEADRWVKKLTGQIGSNDSQTVSESAWQELVSFLLASPHYGERWARRWLDLARYADTNGYEKDRDRSIWPYRDWVVSALNAGMPFDEFTIEQLAGDMLPDATVDQRVATGFHRNTMLNEEGGIDPLEFRFHAMTDRVATTGTTWLGLTLGCCQCHTHKYDPISHNEYYSVMALLNNADEPALVLPDEQVDKQWQQNCRKADELLATLADRWPIDEFAATHGRIVNATADSEQEIDINDNGFVTVSGANPDKAVYMVELHLPADDFSAVRLETRGTANGAGPGRTSHGNFVLTGVEIQIAAESEADRFIKQTITSASATSEQANYDVNAAIDGNDATGWGIHNANGIPRTASATFQLDTAVLRQLPPGDRRLRITLRQTLGKQHTIESFRVSTVRKRNQSEIQQLRDTAISTAFMDWLKSEQKNAVNWQQLKPIRATSSLPILTIQDDNSIFASGDTAKRDDYYLTFAPAQHPITALMLEAMPDDRLPAGGPGSTYYEGTLGDFYLTEIQAHSADRRFPFRSASETYKRNRYGSNPVSAALAIDGDVQTGWAVHDRQAERHVAVFVFDRPVPAGLPIEIRMTFGRHFASSLGRFRFSATSESSEPEAREYTAEIAKLIRRPLDSLNKDEHRQLRQTFLLSAAQMKNDAEQIRKLRKRPVSRSTLVFSERPKGHERPTHRHHRGEYLQPRDIVAPDVPALAKSGASESVRNRLEFARWLVSGQNPLTARVVVNRHWQAFFGNGIVQTLGDFGLQGEAPSHPDLLDWLAVTFVHEDRWSLKALHRRIVSSHTYRQASVVSPEAAKVDPANRLLSYSPRFRLDAEIVRDQFLQAAGILAPEMGGPPVRPLQPAGVSEVAYGNPKWTASSGDARYRRSLYTYTKRTAPFAMFSAFDAPTGESCVAGRNRSNSPLQALTLLNDVMILDLARHAGRAAASSAVRNGTDSELRRLFRRMLVRPPTADEAQSLSTFLTEQRDLYNMNRQAARQLMDASQEKVIPENLADQASWTATARAIFGLDESLSRD